MGISDLAYSTNALLIMGVWQFFNISEKYHFLSIAQSKYGLHALSCVTVLQRANPCALSS
jgi:hypothetical protein